MTITEMIIQDYPDVFTLWQNCEGIGLHGKEDSAEGISSFLQRNRGLSFIAREDGRIVGAVLCGHDGRRGYLHHLAIDANFRRKGIGRILVKQALSKLWMAGIRKCHIFVIADNVEGLAFWQRIGWSERTDVKLASKCIDADLFCSC